MKSCCFMSLLLTLISFSSAWSQHSFETDTIPTKSGNLLITFIGHGTLMFTYNNLVIHVDPVSRYADYNKLPAADLILVTHHHGDHLDPETIEILRKEDTRIVLTETCFQTTEYGTVLKNGETKKIRDITIEAVPAYNLVHLRDNGKPFHPKGTGNGYVINFGDKKVYIAGDTENVPEMKHLTGIDIAFLPMNLPYTMTPEMVADATRAFKPKILYPYHFGSTNVNELLELLEDFKDTEIRVRKME